ncbi:CHAT domain-containing protein [Mycena pura]|uniref:CHAT domain-containing protein n=1 Tax=Mycena pura TaxID=153505 RepID=A0AAD6VC90_9AGAR|nr:CHAT domain-containing protein [Mycena pura]
MPLQSTPSKSGVYLIKVFTQDLYIESVPQGESTASTPWLRLASPTGHKKQQWVLTQSSSNSDEWTIVSAVDSAGLVYKKTGQTYRGHGYPYPGGSSISWKIVNYGQFSKISAPSNGRDVFDSQYRSQKDDAVHFWQPLDQFDAPFQCFVFEFIGDIPGAEDMKTNTQILTEPSDTDSYDIIFERGFEHLMEHHGLVEVLDKIDSISKAIAAFERAYTIFPNDRPLVNLANCLFRRYELDPVCYRDDLDAAIGKQRQGVALQKEANIVSLNNLGNMLRCRFDSYTRAESESDLNEALGVYERVMIRYLENPNISLLATRSRGELLLAHRGAPAALGTYKYTMDIIPHLSSAGRKLLQRFNWLPNVRECVESAVAAAIATGELELALEWFEQGRCVVWFQIMRSRMSLDDLREVDPTLADSVGDVLQQLSVAEARLEGITGQSIQTPGRDKIYEKGRNLASRLEELIRQVRRLDGFQDFMEHKPTGELRAAAIRGPVIAINVSQARCDALVLVHGSTEIIHVPLPRLTREKAIEMKKCLQGCLQSAGRLARKLVLSGSGSDASEMGHELTQLWLLVVEPILSKIGYLDSPHSHETRRVVWCPSGPLCFLPLHAAGIYSGLGVGKTVRVGASAKAIDLVASSYVPSISSLLEAAQKPRSILAVSQPATPNLNPIPATVEEILGVQDIVGTERLKWLNGEEAKISAVLELLRSEEYSWLHLACHGVQNMLQSAFMLHDGRLDLREIMHLSIGQKELAILSACETAAGDDGSPEEGLHLSAGMLMAGYKNVVGTMWSVGDKDAPIVMKELYSCLLDKTPKAKVSIAHALHMAVKALRTEVGEKNFLQWVPFIHVGM